MIHERVVSAVVTEIRAGVTISSYGRDAPTVANITVEAENSSGNRFVFTVQQTDEPKIGQLMTVSISWNDGESQEPRGRSDDG